MKALIQRVANAAVLVDGEVVGSIAKGIVVLLGIATQDTQEDAVWLSKKLAGLRIFNDAEGAMNLSIQEVGGQFLVVSQFTLIASYKKGNRPSFLEAARPEVANPLYAYFVESLREASNTKVATGIFGAHMEVKLTNDGPVTIMLDSQNKQ